MQTFKYFNQEGNTYIKKTQVTLYIIISLFLFIVVGFVLYKNPNPGAKWTAILFGLLGVVLLFRCTAKLTFNTTTRIITVQPSILSKPREFRFEDFQNFLISKQTMLITLNATASMIMDKNGKDRTLLLHQAMIYTKPLQQVTDEAARIMGIPQ
jgi:isoprenylcysteine carboxyl methyltransferase (ICMT) family protein YpbQ